VKLATSIKKILAAIPALSRREKAVFGGFLAIAFVGLIWLGWNFYISRTAIAPRSGGIYTEGIVGSPRLINPVLADTNEADGALEAIVFSGLLRVDGRGGLEPDLAEFVKPSEDKREYLITLKPNLFWHDGERLTADDVLFTIDLIKNPALRNPYALNWQGVTAEKISDRSIKITIPVPYEPFGQNLTFRILPKHLWRDVPTQNFALSELNLKPIGSGPYRFKKFDQDKAGNITAYTLTANKRYHLAGPYIDTIVLRFYPKYEDAIMALKKKEIDGLAGIPPEYTGALADSGSLQMFSPMLPRYFAVFWNTEVPPFDDKRMRLALALAVNRSRLIDEVLRGNGKIVNGPIPAEFISGTATATPEYNPASSTQILDDLGWKVGTDGIREKSQPGGRRPKPPTKLEFELFLPDTPLLQEIASRLIQDWQAVGIRVTAKPLTVNELLTTLQARSYRSILYGQLLTQDPDPFSFWHSSQKQAPGLNLSLWSNKAADDILEKAREIDNADPKKELLMQFQNLVIQDQPALFLYSPNYVVVAAAAFHFPEMKIFSFPSDRFQTINEWHLYTKRIWRKS